MDIDYFPLLLIAVAGIITVYGVIHQINLNNNQFTITKQECHNETEVIDWKPTNFIFNNYGGYLDYGSSEACSSFYYMYICAGENSSQRLNDATCLNSRPQFSKCNITLLNFSEKIYSERKIEKNKTIILDNGSAYIVSEVIDTIPAFVTQNYELLIQGEVGIKRTKQVCEDKEVDLITTGNCYKVNSTQFITTYYGDTVTYFTNNQTGDSYGCVNNLSVNKLDLKEDWLNKNTHCIIGTCSNGLSVNYSNEDSQFLEAHSNYCSVGPELIKCSKWKIEDYTITRK